MENKTMNSNGNLVIVNSKNRTRGFFGKNKKYNLQVKAKDLPEGVNKNDLVVAFRVNAQEEKKNDKETRFKARYLAPILIPLVLLGAVKGCQSSEPVPVPEPKKIVEQIDFQYNDIDSPHIFMEAVTNAKGQEGMTAEKLNNDENMFEGKYYNSDQQFEDEKRASTGQEDFEKMEVELDECFEVLSNPQSTQEEKAEAAKNALNINMQIEKIYEDNLEFIENGGKSFEDSSNEFKDSNTEAEIKVIRATIDEYKENHALTTENVNNLAQIVMLTEEGYDIDVSMIENTRGDYSISGEAVKFIAEEVGLDKEAQEVYNNFVGDKEQKKKLMILEA